MLGTDYPFPLGDLEPGKLIYESNFESESDLNQQIGSESLLKCLICGIRFFSKSSLNNHIANEHGNRETSTLKPVLIKLRKSIERESRKTNTSFEISESTLHSSMFTRDNLILLGIMYICFSAKSNFHLGVLFTQKLYSYQSSKRFGQLCLSKKSRGRIIC